MCCMLQSIFYCSLRLLSSIHTPQPSLFGLAAVRGFVAARWTVSRDSTLLARRNMADVQEYPSKRKHIRIGWFASQKSMPVALVGILYSLKQYVFILLILPCLAFFGT